MTSAACNSLFTFFSPLQSCQIVPERARALLPPYWSALSLFRERSKPIDVDGVAELREEEDGVRAGSHLAPLGETSQA